MSPIYAYEIVGMQESLANVLSEHKASTPLRDAETLHIRFRVTPHEVGEGAFVGNFLHPLDTLDIINAL